jgi:hypothetical protein
MKRTVFAPVQDATELFARAEAEQEHFSSQHLAKFNSRACLCCWYTDLGLNNTQNIFESSSQLGRATC